MAGLGLEAARSSALGCRLAASGALMSAVTSRARSVPVPRPLSVGFPYSADRFGGSTISSMILARSLMEHGHRVCVVAHGDGPAIEEAAGRGLDIVRLPAFPSASDAARADRLRTENILAFGTCRRAIRELSLDIVHVNDLAMLRTWALPARSARIKLVAHWRSNYHESWSVDAGLRLAHVIIAVSEYSKSGLPPWARAKTIVEYNPFGLFYDERRRSEARPRIRAQLGVPTDAALVGVFGNHTVRKRTHILADILNALPATTDGRPVYGLACGGRVGPHDTLLGEKIAAFRLEQRLLRPGFVRPVEDWMAACDVILAPAEREPLARNVLEAQGVGVPVVVSADGGLREVVADGETGVVLDPFDLNGWIGATERLLNDAALCEAMSTTARQRLEQLSPRRHASRIDGIYQRIVQAGVGRMAAHG
jgi:glycosyltransferase involved in cell wall biosynthesis